MGTPTARRDLLSIQKEKYICRDTVFREVAGNVENTKSHYVSRLCLRDEIYCVTRCQGRPVWVTERIEVEKTLGRCY